jgi:membrane-associated phospholipid phosphatase
MHESRPGRRTLDVGVAPTLIVLATAVLLFLVIAFAVALSGAVTAIDANVGSWFHLRATPLFTGVMATVSFFGAPTTLTVVVAATCLVLLCQRRYADAATISIVVLGGNVLNFCLKHLVHRARPVFDDPVFSLPSYSFPSGHAMASTVFWGLLAIYASVHSQRRHAGHAGIAVAALMVALVCLSRVYLGLHYVSDVAAGVAEGVAWLALSLVALRFIRPTGAGANLGADR